MQTGAPGVESQSAVAVQGWSQTFAGVDAPQAGSVLDVSVHVALLVIEVQSLVAVHDFVHTPQMHWRPLEQLAEQSSKKCVALLTCGGGVSPEQAPVAQTMTAPASSSDGIRLAESIMFRAPLRASSVRHT
jgi:hypothetical protein